MSNITIQKVKLIKQGEKLEVQFKETGDMKASTDKICDNPCHPDLKKAMAGLGHHLAILTDYITEKRAGDTEELEKFVVTAYSIGGKEDEEGVTITGYRKTRSGKTVTLNTPFLKLDAESDEYYLIKDLNTRIESIEAEVLLYLEGKKAPDAQTSLEFPEENVNQEQITKMQIVPPAGDGDLTQLFRNELSVEDKGNGMKVVTDEDPLGLNDSGTAKPTKEKKPNKKKVAQTAEAPSGEVVVNE